MNAVSLDTVGLSCGLGLEGPDDFKAEVEFLFLGLV
jgi:hypothetical protein